MRYLFARSHRTPSSRPNGVEEDQATLTGTVGFGKKNFQQLFIDMKHKLPSVSERLFTKGRAKQRAAIAALSMGGIDNRTIAVFMETHPKTVYRWVCRIEEGKPLTDIQRCGRPRRFSEAARLTTIAVYCQHSPPLPGVHLWSLRDAQRYFKKHPETMDGGMTDRVTKGRQVFYQFQEV